MWFNEKPSDESVFDKVRSKPEENSKVDEDEIKRRAVFRVIKPTQKPLIVGLEKVRLFLRASISDPLQDWKQNKCDITQEDLKHSFLLYGPPGCGKSQLAQLVAVEANASLINASASELFNKYVGETSKMVSTLFSLAQEVAPCVIFIDEVDSMMKKRKEEDTNDALNQLLLEFGRIDQKQAAVFLICATNLPSVMDSAMASRFVDNLHVRLPNALERKEILKLRLNHEHNITEEQFNILAELSNNFSSRDLCNYVKKAKTAQRYILKNGRNVTYQVLAAELRSANPKTTSSDIYKFETFEANNRMVLHSVNRGEKRNNQSEEDEKVPCFPIFKILSIFA